MSVPVWVLERQESLNHVAFCPTRNKWVLATGTAIKDSSDGFKFSSVNYPFTDSILGVAGTDTGSTRGNIVVITQSNSRIYELDNAGNWTNVTPVLTGTFNQIVYLPGIGFLVLGVRLGSPVNWLSTDGVNWTGPYTHNFGNSTVFVGTPGFICSINSGTAVDYSPDGVGWTLRTTGLGTKGVAQVTYVPALAKWIGYAFDAGHTNTWITQCDADGTNWSVIFTFGSYIEPQNIIFEPHSGYIILVCIHNAIISTDGTSWTTMGMIDPNGFASNPLGIAGKAGQIIVLGLSGGTWSPNDNVMTEISASDINPFSTWTVNGGYNAPATVHVVGNGPYTLDFTANNPVPPDVYVVTRKNSPSGTNQVIAAASNAIAGVHTYSGIVDNVPTTPGIKEFDVFGIDSNNQQITPVASVIAGADIDVTMSGGIALGGAASIVFISDPSGIYTLVKGKTHDTLYERLSGTTTQDVKIPDPFFVTTAVGSDEVG